MGLCTAAAALLLLLAARGAAGALPPDVIALLTDVTHASGAVYGLRDDHGRSMDCVRVVRLPQPAPAAAAAAAAPFSRLLVLVEDRPGKGGGLGSLAGVVPVGEKELLALAGSKEGIAELILSHTRAGDVVLHGQGEIGGTIKSFVHKRLAHHLGAFGQAFLKCGIGGMCVFVCHKNSVD